ncbi:BTAD domain-containing putative transcriptional regulator [Saccharothrix stipae]
MDPGQAVHRTIVVVDVEGFGDPRRTLPHQIGTRAGLYRMMGDALRAAGVAWVDCYHEDRGDSVFVLVPPEFAKAPLVEVLPAVLAEALREHNDTSPAAQHTRLRVAVHAGEVVFDGHGVTSTAVTTAFRLLDAPPVKEALAGSPALVALVVSRWIFDEVVRHSAALDPATFRPVAVEVKEVRDTAWIALPDHPYPADSAVLDRPVNPVAPGGSGVMPRQLPGAPAMFVGREEYLAVLDRALTPADGAPGTDRAAVVSALGGAGGIGKTWLALHWAHRQVDQFPDGQLFVDLRGFSPDSPPLDPAVAVRGFLDALGVGPDRLPVGLDTQTALYRSLIAGRRMLIVLDNAATADQVIPLLPGTPTCMALITGRSSLASLIERHGARHLQLDILSLEEARALLTERLGEARVATEIEATDELIQLCGRYPLALSITARHAATYPTVPLAEFATELRELGLEVLDHDTDPSAGLPGVLSWSLRHLTPEQRQAFMLLGMAPGPDTGMSAAACLIGMSAARTRQVLRVLEDASLIDRRPHGRYAMHDLIRSYATTLAQDLPEPVRRAALERVVDFYLHTADAAARLVDPHTALTPLGPPTPDVRPHPLPDQRAALAWLDAEHPHLLAAQHTAAAQHQHHTAWSLAWILTDFHRRRGHLHDDVAAWRAALDSAGHLSDPSTLIRTHRHLGAAQARLVRHDEAIRHLHQALALAKQHHDTTQEAHTHHELVQAWEQRGDDRMALEHTRSALNLYRVLNNPVWEASTLNLLGWFTARLDDYETAREHCQAALALHRRHRNPDGEADTLDSLGYIEHHTGNHRQAVHHYHQALDLDRALGHTYQTANTLDSLGHPYSALGEHERARAVWREALELYREQGRDTDAQRVQRQLDAFGQEL